MVKDLVIVEQKTNKPRKIAVSKELRKSVKEEFATHFGRIRKTELIFLNKDGSDHISISYVNKHLKKLFKKHGVEADQVSSHLLRKSFCYKVLEDNDFSDKAIFVISGMLNHANVNTTMKYLLLDKRESDKVYKSLTLQVK